MLVNWTSSGMFTEPRRDAVFMKSAQTLQTCHLIPNSEFFETNGALCIIDAILLRCGITIHACQPGYSWRSAILTSAQRSIRAVSLDTLRDM
jgi:hypothetical protein